MLKGLRSIAVAVLCLPYVLAGAQAFMGVIKNPGVPDTIAIKDMPTEFRAIDIRTTASDFTQAMQMSMYSFGGSSQKNTYELFQFAQTSWTEGKILSTSSGEFVVTYRLGYGPSENGGPPKVNDNLRLVLIRKDSIIEIAPRTDLTRARLLELISPQAQIERQTASAQTTALSNMKQLALGMIMYTGDYDDVMPYVQDSKSAFAVTQPYLKNSQLQNSLNPGSRILMNMSIAGVEVTLVEAPADTVLYYDEKAWPDGRHLVAFLDGHVKYVDPDGWQKCQASLHLKLRRKAKPLPADYWRKLNPGNGGLGTS